MTPLAQTVAEHLAALEAMGYAGTTIASRRLSLRQFLAWCSECTISELADLSPSTLESYRQWVFAQRGRDGRAWDWSTQANKLTSVRMFCSWAARTRRLAMDPAAGLQRPRLPRRLPRAVLSPTEVERILAQPDVSMLLGLRDRAILEVLYSTGLRRMELIRLRTTDLDAERGVVFVREGKGRRDRVVPIGNRAIEWVSRYLATARPRLARRRDAGALFLNVRGGWIGPSRLTERCHAYVLAAGVSKSGSVHIFRHTMATLMHDAGADIRDLQELLGMRSSRPPRSTPGCRSSG
jgi:integrase/recombinase XerD